jgi:hypothetical protein
MAAFAITFAAAITTALASTSFHSRQRWFPSLRTFQQWLQSRPEPGHLHTEAEVVDAPPARVYVYEGHGTEWLKRCSNYTFASQNFMPDPALHQALLRHPWRTLDASEANLFFVPVYWGGCGNLEENMKATAEMLQQSSYFQRNKGADHVLSAFAWSVRPENLGPLQPLTTNMIIGRFELQSSFGNWSREFVLPYGGVASRAQHEASPFLLSNEVQLEWKSRKHSLFMMGQADSRHAYRERRIALRKLRDAFPDAVLVQTGDMNFTHWEAQDPLDTPDLLEELPMCSDLGTFAGCRRTPASSKDYVDDYIALGRDSKFVLALHGDTPSSSRVYDAFQFGAVPIFVAPGWDSHATPFPDEIPWQDLAVFVDQDQFIHDPVRETRSAVARASEEGRRTNIVKYRPAVDWTMPGHCIGTVVLTHIARHFLGQSTLPAGQHHSTVLNLNSFARRCGSEAANI